MPLLGRPGRGRVIWSRTAGPVGDSALNAAWLRLPDGVVGLAPRGAPLGPRWVCRPEPWPALTEGHHVLVDRTGLHTGEDVLFLESRQAVGWRGPLPDPDQVAAAAPRAVIAEALSSCRPGTLVDEPWRAAAEPALEAIGRMPPLDALTIAARTLGGLGPGLTPAGDDALSGLLFALRAMGGTTVEPALLAVARSVHTSDVATPLLEAAAAGCHIEPVHDLVMAAATDDVTAAHRAARELNRFGSSSGADIGYGLRLAFARR